ncbi:hypothetical protein B0H13DRAFT_1877094 [Mycena leptocephala]|nr:hypothetical protein B0H13DRAFT_1877094 [Mycena leptocephala]
MLLAPHFPLLARCLALPPALTYLALLHLYFVSSTSVVESRAHLSLPTAIPSPRTLPAPRPRLLPPSTPNPQAPNPSPKLPGMDSLRPASRNGRREREERERDERRERSPDTYPLFFLIPRCELSLRTLLSSTYGVNSAYLVQRASRARTLNITIILGGGAGDSSGRCLQRGDPRLKRESGSDPVDHHRGWRLLCSSRLRLVLDDAVLQEGDTIGYSVYRHTSVGSKKQKQEGLSLGRCFARRLGSLQLRLGRGLSKPRLALVGPSAHVSTSHSRADFINELPTCSCSSDFALVNYCGRFFFPSTFARGKLASLNEAMSADRQ